MFRAIGIARIPFLLFSLWCALALAPAPADARVAHHHRVRALHGHHVSRAHANRTVLEARDSRAPASQPSSPRRRSTLPARTARNPAPHGGNDGSRWATLPSFFGAPELRLAAWVPKPRYARSRHMARWAFAERGPPRAAPLRELVSLRPRAQAPSFSSRADLLSFDIYRSRLLGTRSLYCVEHSARRERARAISPLSPRADCLVALPSLITPERAQPRSRAGRTEDTTARIVPSSEGELS